MIPLPQLPRPFCAHWKSGLCVHHRAWIMWGTRLPKPEDCRRCGFREGQRGLGDFVATVVSWTPWGRRKQAAGCVPCKKRQDALNAAVPFKKCGACAKKQESAQAP